MHERASLCNAFSEYQGDETLPLDPPSTGKAAPSSTLWTDQRGFTRLETAAIFLAFAALAAGFIYFVVSTSILAAKGSREAVLSGLQLEGETLTLSGVVAGLTNPDKTALDLVRFRVTNASTLFERVDLSSNRTIFTYIDTEQVVRLNQPYWSATWITGSAKVLNPGETVEIKVDLRGIDLSVATSREFTLQLIPDQGNTLSMTFTTPPKFKKFTVQLQPKQKSANKAVRGIE